jgi:phosphohistidine phosphatase
MLVFLLRHADAVPGEPDAGRSLSPQGRRQSARVGRSLGLEVWSLVRAIEHSPLKRSVQTAQLVQSAAKVRQPLQVLVGLEPEANPQVTAAQLARSRSSRLLVGHNPHLSALVGLLLGLRDGAEGIHFRKAALVTLERLAGPTARKPYGTWRLKSMVPPPVGK